MAHTTPAPTLQELIADRRGGRSYARLAEQCGGKPSASRWHQLATDGPADLSQQDTIIPMAEVLGVTPFAVLRAFAVSLGWAVETAPAPLIDRLAAYDLKRLSAAQVDAVVDMVKVLIPGK